MPLGTCERLVCLAWLLVVQLSVLIATSHDSNACDGTGTCTESTDAFAQQGESLLQIRSNFKVGHVKSGLTALHADEDCGENADENFKAALVEHFKALKASNTTDELDYLTCEEKRMFMKSFTKDMLKDCKNDVKIVQEWVVKAATALRQPKSVVVDAFVENVDEDIEPTKWSDEFKGLAAAVAEEESALISFQRKRLLNFGTSVDSEDKGDEEEEEKHKKIVKKVQKAIRRERKRAGGHVGYWNVLKAEKVNPVTKSCSRVLQHSGLELQDLTDSATGDSATTKLCAGMTLGKNGSETPIGCHARNAMLLEYVAWTLPKFNLTWYIEAGTLLGAVREGGFINHETDTDVAIYLASMEDWHNVGLWANQVVEDGLDSNNISHWHPMGGHQFTLKTWKHGAHLDLYFVRPRDGEIWFAPGGPHWEKTWAREVIFPLQFTCNIHGFLLPCPQDPQEYLRALYPGSYLMVPEHRWCQGEHEKQHRSQTWKNETSSNKFEAAPCKEMVPMEDLKKGIAASVKCLAKSGNAFILQS